MAAEYHRAKVRAFVQACRWANQYGYEIDPNAYRLGVIDINRWNPQVADNLWYLGFFHLLDVADPASYKPQHDQHILPFICGDNVDPEETGKLTERIRNLLNQLSVPENETTFHLQGRIIEAVDNVCAHAYPEGISWRFPHIGKWWAAASVDTEANRLFLSVYDQGVTIPGSIPISPKSSAIVPRLKKLIGIDEEFTDPCHDGKAIRAAMQSGQTETGEEHRGKGLMFMRDLVTLCDHSELRILSRNGAYSYRSDGSEDDWVHSTSIGGTLIEWSLHLPDRR